MGTGYPDYKLSYIHDRKTIAILDGIWHDIRIAYDSSGNLLYRGVNEIHNASSTAATWEIWKYTYDSSNRVTRVEGPLSGSWDGRASLTWG